MRISKLIEDPQWNGKSLKETIHDPAQNEYEIEIFSPNYYPEILLRFMHNDDSLEAIRR